MYHYPRDVNRDLHPNPGHAPRISEAAIALRKVSLHGWNGDQVLDARKGAR